MLGSSPSLGQSQSLGKLPFLWLCSSLGQSATLGHSETLLQSLFLEGHYPLIIIFLRMVAIHSTVTSLSIYPYASTTTFVVLVFSESQLRDRDWDFFCQLWRSRMKPRMLMSSKSRPRFLETWQKMLRLRYFRDSCWTLSGRCVRGVLKVVRSVWKWSWRYLEGVWTG